MEQATVHLPGILLAYGVLLIGIFSPGPAVLAIIGTALERGRQPASAMAAGVASGSVIWGIAAAAGISALLVTFAEVLIVLKIAGGLYMLFLAWKAFRSARSSHDPTPSAVPARSQRRMFIAGLALHLTNPKAVLAWLATVSLGLTAESPVWVAFAIVGGGAIISIVGNGMYAILFSNEVIVRFYLKARRTIQYVFAGFFALAGLRLITSR